jgi:hypothetical protein
MRNLLVASLFALVSVSATAATPIDGTWKMTQRTCSSGAIPNDVLGNLSDASFLLKLENDVAQLDMAAQGSTATGIGKYVYADSVLTLTLTKWIFDGKEQPPEAPEDDAIPVTLAADSKSFTIHVGPFGPHGNCPENDYIDMLLVRQ